MIDPSTLTLTELNTASLTTTMTGVYENKGHLIYPIRIYSNSSDGYLQKSSITSYEDAAEQTPTVDNTATTGNFGLGETVDLSIDVFNPPFPVIVTDVEINLWRFYLSFNTKHINFTPKSIYLVFQRYDFSFTGGYNKFSRVNIYQKNWGDTLTAGVWDLSGTLLKTNWMFPFVGPNNITSGNNRWARIRLPREVDLSNNLYLEFRTTTDTIYPPASGLAIDDTWNFFDTWPSRGATQYFTPYTSESTATQKPYLEIY